MNFAGFIGWPKIFIQLLIAACGKALKSMSCLVCENTPGIKIIGPKGEVTIKEGVICAWRHIHMTPDDAEIFGVEDGDIVEVEVKNGSRPLTFGNVLIRVSPKFKLEMHIDTDEANAAELSQNAEGALLNTEGTATLLKKNLKR